MNNIPNVFLDTSIFEQNNFTHGTIKQICLLGEQKLVKLFITDIVKQEITARVAVNFNSVKNEFEKFFKGIEKSDNRIFKNSGILEKVTKLKQISFDAERLGLVKRIDVLLQQSRVTTISTTKISAKIIFDKYFKNTYPFSKGDKKSEFPDAFNLQAVKEYFIKLKEKVYVVSKDKDLLESAYSSQMIFIEDIAEIIDLVLKYRNEESTIDTLVSVIKERKDEVFKSLKEYFPKYIHFDTGDADLLHVEILDCHIENIFLKQFKDGITTFTCNLDVFYEAQLRYKDYSSAYYDKEDHKWLFLEMKTETVERRQIVPYNISFYDLTDFFKFNDAELAEMEFEGVDEEFFIRLDIEDYGHPERYQ